LFAPPRLQAGRLATQLWAVLKLATDDLSAETEPLKELTLGQFYPAKKWPRYSVVVELSSNSQPVHPKYTVGIARRRSAALEFFAPLYDRTAQAKVVGELKRLQDCLGEFQDTQVQIGEIRALATAMLAAGEAPAVTLLAMGEVTAGLVSRQRAAREDFGRRFAAFAGIDGQRRMSALLRGKPGVGS